MNGGAWIQSVAIGLLVAPLWTATPRASQPGASLPVSLHGSASLGRNRPVVGAVVLVRREGEARRLYLTATDSDGRFRIEGLEDGEYRVEVRHQGLQPVVKESVELRFPMRAVIEVTMEPAPQDDAPDPAAGGAPVDELPRVAIRGELIHRDGVPLPGVRLRFVRKDGRADPVVVRSAEDGTFELPPLAAGRWRVEARVVGFLPIRTTADLREDMGLRISMVRQPHGYEPSPLDLAPPEQPVPPERFGLEPGLEPPPDEAASGQSEERREPPDA